ncbi:Glycosyl transferase family 2 [compost metagenome]
MAQWSLYGFERMRLQAEQQGISVQLVAVLDNVDSQTRRIVEGHPVVRACDCVLLTAHGDPGLARNAGISAASGHYVGILDGDDYCSANWISTAVGVLRENPQVVVHTDYLVVFGSTWGLGRQSNQLAGEGDRESCFKFHLWVSTVFASRNFFLRCPYRATRMAASGFGYEDWDWSLAVLAKGALHVTAPTTALFYRQKDDGSRQRAAESQQVIVAPGPFFSAEFWMQRGQYEHKG